MIKKSDKKIYLAGLSVFFNLSHKLIKRGSEIDSLFKESIYLIQYKITETAPKAYKLGEKTGWNLYLLPKAIYTFSKNPGHTFPKIRFWAFKRYILIFLISAFI